MIICSLAMESAETARKADDSYGRPRSSLIGVLKQEGPFRRAGGAMASFADLPPYKRYERPGTLAGGPARGLHSILPYPAVTETRG